MTYEIVSYRFRPAQQTTHPYVRETGTQGPIHALPQSFQQRIALDVGATVGELRRVLAKLVVIETEDGADCRRDLGGGLRGQRLNLLLNVDVTEG